MDLKIQNKVTIITGGGGGIGKACALAFAKEGATVCVNDVDRKSGEDTLNKVRAFGANGIFVTGDVSSEDDVKTIFHKVDKEFGKIDILVNNAGISPKLPFYEITGEMFEKVQNINLKSSFLCSKEAFLYMKNNGWGRIISVSSLAGLYGGINSAAHYAASKAGIIGMTKTLAKQMGKYNITVNCVAPGRINTPMTSMLTQEQIEEILAKTPLGRLGTVEEVADTIVFLASERSSYITGSCIEILGGYTG